MEEYFRRANELKESVIGNYEHSTDIQDYELVGWLIEQAKKVEILNAENELLQAKWGAQGLMIQKLHQENANMKKYISNGVEFGYIDDREGDYKKFI